MMLMSGALGMTLPDTFMRFVILIRAEMMIMRLQGRGRGKFENQVRSNFKQTSAND